MRKLLLILTVSLFITQTAFAGENYCSESNFKKVSKEIGDHRDDMKALEQEAFKVSGLIQIMDLVSDEYTPSELGKLLAAQNTLATYGVSVGKNILANNVNAIDQSIDQLNKLGNELLKRAKDYSFIGDSCYEFAEYKSYNKARSLMKNTVLIREGIFPIIAIFKKVREELIEEVKFYQETEEAVKAYKAGCAYKEQN